jgi:hypothetical protein
VDPGLIVGIIGVLVAATAAYIAWEQLRRTQKPIKIGKGRAAAVEPPQVTVLDAVPSGTVKQAALSGQITGSFAAATAADVPGTVDPPSLLPRLEHPSRLVANWVGRAEELDRLNRWAASGSGTPVCCIEGIMGAGKSALTWKWLYDTVLSDQAEVAFDAVMQWSFAQGKTSLGDYLLTLCTYLDIEVDDQDPIAGLRDYLIRHRVLLVLDGFEYLLSAYAPKVPSPREESAANDGAVDDRAAADVLTARWIRMLTTLTGSRALLVSKFVPDELESTPRCTRIVLGGFTSEESVSYLRGRGVKGSTAELMVAAEFYGYHPLTLDRLVNVLRYDIVAPSDIGRAQIDAPVVETDLAERQGHLFQEAFNTLSSDLQRFLGTLSAIRGQIPGLLARGICPEIPDNTFRLWLRRLEEDHWLYWDRERNSVSIHPVVRRCAYSELVNRAEVHEGLRSYFAAVTSAGEPSSRDELEALIELFHHTLRSGRLDEAAELFFDRLSRSIDQRPLRNDADGHRASRRTVLRRPAAIGTQ